MNPRQKGSPRAPWGLNSQANCTVRMRMLRLLTENSRLIRELMEDPRVDGAFLEMFFVMTFAPK